MDMGTCSVLELTSCLWLWVGLGTQGNFRREQTRVFACQACSFFENKFSSQTLSKHLSSLRSQLFAPGQFQEQVITASSFQGTYFPDWFPYFVHSPLLSPSTAPLTKWRENCSSLRSETRTAIFLWSAGRPHHGESLKDLRGVKWVDLYLLSCLHCGFKAITQAPQVPACWWHSLPECLSSGLWACSASSHNCIVSWDR